MAPLVSAIIPTYNRAALLRRALDSVCAQGHRPLEAIVVDDGSTDETEAVVEECRRKLARAGVELVYRRQNNGRAPSARNTGMKLARGSLLAFLDSDDLWRPSFVAALVRLLERYPSAGLGFCGILVVDDEDRVWKVRECGMNGLPRQGLLKRPFEAILRYMPMQTSGVMVRKSVIEDVGDFDLDLPVVEDWDLWYRIARKHDFAYTLDGLACNRSHPDNLPKFDAVALSSSLRMNLKHLPAVRCEETRQVLLERIERQFILLQEELLREGKAGNGHSHLLCHELAPQNPRFELGTMMTAAPQWLGRSYGRLVRMLGELKRGVGC